MSFHVEGIKNGESSLDEVVTIDIVMTDLLADQGVEHDDAGRRFTMEKTFDDVVIPEGSLIRVEELGRTEYSDSVGDWSGSYKGLFLLQADERGNTLEEHWVYGTPYGTVKNEGDSYFVEFINKAVWEE